MNQETNPRKAAASSVPSGFFALRTPLLPFDEFLSWSEGLEAEAALGEPARLDQALAGDRGRLRDRLRNLMALPLVRDAIFIASPDLDESLDVWTREPESERGTRIERAIVRYFARMSGRATPFGLFAGTSVGTIGTETRFLLEAREKSRRRSRLDMDYLFALAQAVGRDPALRRGLPLCPNSSLYHAAGRVHYVEARLDGKNRSHHLVAAEDSEDLRATLDRAREGASQNALAESLVREEVSTDEAQAYVNELIESQILQPDLAPPVTGSDPTAALAAQLHGRTETASIGDPLDAARRALAAIDAAGLGADPFRYRTVAKALEGLPAPVELSRLFQVDLVKSSPDARLGGAVLAEIVRGIEILRRLEAPGKPAELERFRERFVERYEGREVALVEALDEEAGIGLSDSAESAADGGPLLQGIDLSRAESEMVAWGPREKSLLRRLTEALAAGTREIAIDPEKLGDLERKDLSPLPAAFAAIGSVAAASEEALDRGEFRVLLNGCDGPSGARLLGRFCDADAVLQRRVEEHLRSEEALDPEAVFAEIVHLPEGRLGNILFRPVLRGHEIPYLGRSGAPPERQIPVTDLRVSVSEGRIVLRSARLKRRIIPRLTSAHNFQWRGLPLYRFLCGLQTLGTAVPRGWDWGPLWSAPFLPRVVCGRLVLALAHWNVSREELKRLTGRQGSDLFRAVASWREERGLPRLVVLADGDNRLPVDLANVLSVESFVQTIKDRDEARLTEMFPGPAELFARGPEGSFVHEFLVPFVLSSKPTSAEDGARSPEPAVQNAPEPVPGAPRVFPPRSEWLYAKLYTGAANSDRLLREVVAPLVEKTLGSGAADRWFFIRYADPHRHIRLRFHGDPSVLHGELFQELHLAAQAPLGDGVLWKWQLDTYEPEIERYGGPEAIASAERIFQRDSEAVLEILDMLEEGDAGADERWRLALRGIDLLLEDFGLDLPGKRRAVERVHSDFAGEFRPDASARRGLGERYRKEARGLERLFDPAEESVSPLAPGLDVLRRRSQRLASEIGELRRLRDAGRLTRSLETILASVVHMHVNRMLRSAQRAQEFVLYDFLARLYTSRASRRSKSV